MNLSVDKELFLRTKLDENKDKNRNECISSSIFSGTNVKENTTKENSNIVFKNKKFRSIIFLMMNYREDINTLYKDIHKMYKIFKEKIKKNLKTRLIQNLLKIYSKKINNLDKIYKLNLTKEEELVIIANNIKAHVHKTNSITPNLPIKKKKKHKKKHKKTSIISNNISNISNNDLVNSTFAKEVSGKFSNRIILPAISNKKIQPIKSILKTKNHTKIFNKKK